MSIADVGPVEIKEELSASYVDYKTFLEGPVWRDLEQAMAAELRYCRDNLEDVNTIEDLRKQQARADALRWCIQLPYNHMLAQREEAALSVEQEQEMNDAGSE